MSTSFVLEIENSVRKVASRNANTFSGQRFLKKTFRDVEHDRILDLDLP